MFGGGGFGGFGQQNQQQPQQTQPSTGLFGQTAATPAFGAGGGFGAGTTSAFGQQQQPAATGFGATAAGAPGLGGATGATSAFGAPKPAFGAAPTTGGLFGGAAAQPTQTAGFGGFGGASTGTGFGASSTTTGGGLFGQKPATTGGLFGGTTTTTPGTSAFGGGATTTTGFGAPGGSTFGAGAGTTGGFGAAATGGQTMGNTNQGTGNPPYAASSDKEGTAPNTFLVNYQSISAMPAYKNYSFEELRVQDYLMNKKHANNAPAAGGFGQTSAFGASTGGFGASTTTGFGATAQQQQQPGSSLFGGQTQPSASTPFGAPSTTTGFGAGATSTGFGFGQQQQQQAQPQAGGLFGNTQSTGGGLFGAGAGAGTTTTGFGAPATGTTGFGGASTTGPTGFGFGQQQQQPQQQKPAFGGFGATSTTGQTSAFGAPSTTTTGFGQPAAQTSAFGATTGATGGLFGAKPATTGATGFGLGGATTGATGFGATTQPSTGGLFGGNTLGGAPGATNTGFGAAPSAAPSTGFGFGGAQQQQQPQQGAATGGLFGQKPAGGFGFGQTATTQPAATGGLFGSTATTQQPGTGSLFGGASAQAPGQTGGLFGQTGATGLTGTTGGLFGGATGTGATTGGGLFGAGAASTTTPGFGGAQPQQPQASGGLFGKPAGTTGFGAGFGGATTTTAAPSFSLGGTTGTTMGSTGGLFGGAGTSTVGATPFGGSSLGGGLGASTLGKGFGTSTGLGTSTLGGGLGGGSMFGMSAAGGQQQAQQASLVASVDRNPYGVQPLFENLANQANTAGAAALLATPVKDKKKPTSTFVSQFRSTPRSSAKLPLRGFTSSGASSVVGAPGTGFSKDMSSTPSSSAKLFDGKSDGQILGLVPFSTRKSVKKLEIRPETFDHEDTGASMTGGATANSSSSATPLRPLSNNGLLRGTPMTGKSFEKRTVAGTKSVSFDPSMKYAGEDASFASGEGDGSFLAQESFSTTTARVSIDTPRQQTGSNGAGTTPGKSPGSAQKRRYAASEYWTSPDMDELLNMSEEELSQVEGFTIGLEGFGQVQFLEPVDLWFVGKSVNPRDPLDGIRHIPSRIVIFENKMVTVYPDEDTKADEGTGLNVPAEIQLEKCYPKNKSTQQFVNDPADPLVAAHVRKLKRMDETEFIDFEAESGRWTFRVQHFSRYGLLDDDEEEEAGAATTATATTSTTTTRVVAGKHAAQRPPRAAAVSNKENRPRVTMLAPEQVMNEYEEEDVYEEDQFKDSFAFLSESRRRSGNGVSPMALYETIEDYEITEEVDEDLARRAIFIKDKVLGENMEIEDMEGSEFDEDAIVGVEVEEGLGGDGEDDEEEQEEGDLPPTNILSGLTGMMQGPEGMSMSDGSLSAALRRLPEERATAQRRQVMRMSLFGNEARPMATEESQSAVKSVRFGALPTKEFERSPSIDLSSKRRHADISTTSSEEEGVGVRRTFSPTGLRDAFNNKRDQVLPSTSDMEEETTFKGVLTHGIQSPKKYQKAMTTLPPLSKSLVYQKQDKTKFLSDAGLMMGRSFRVGWGPGGRLVTVGKVVKSMDGLTEGSSSTENAHVSTLSFHKISVFGSDDAGILEREREKTERTLRVQLNRSVISSSSVRVPELLSGNELPGPDGEQMDMDSNEHDEQDQIPSAYVRPGTTFSNFLEVMGTDLDDLHSRFDKEEKMVWKLCSALWDPIDVPSKRSLSAAQEEFVKNCIRRELFSKWLKESIKEDVNADIAEISAKSDSQSLGPRTVFAYLLGRQIPRAVSEAIASKDLRLATLLSQLSGTGFGKYSLAMVRDSKNVDPQSQKVPPAYGHGVPGSAGLSYMTAEFINAQLDIWSERVGDVAAKEFIKEEYLRIWKVMGGKVETWDESVYKVVTDWKRTLGLIYWYGQGGSMHIADSVRQYEMVLKDADVVQHVRRPLPYYVEKRKLKSGRRGAHMDLCFHLLKIFSSDNYHLDRALLPNALTPHALDHRISWLLSIMLSKVKRVGSFKNADSSVSPYDQLILASEQVTLNLMAQLEFLGMWEWAVFVALFLTIPGSRERAIKDLLCKYFPLSDESDSCINTLRAGTGSGKETQSYKSQKSQTFNFLVEKLKIPKEWIHEAKALKAKYHGRSVLEIVCLIDAKRFNVAHKLIIRHLAPEAIVDGKHKFLTNLLSLIPSAETENWNYGGHVFLDYMTVIDNVPRVMDALDSDPTNTSLKSQLDNLSRKVKDLEDLVFSRQQVLGWWYEYGPSSSVKSSAKGGFAAVHGDALPMEVLIKKREARLDACIAEMVRKVNVLKLRIQEKAKTKVSQPVDLPLPEDQRLMNARQLSMNWLSQF